MIRKEIFGEGKKLNPNSFFSNNTIELFRRDPKELSDSELPIVTNFSGLSKNQRRKFKNWAFDPKWTRIRMEAAQKMLYEKMNSLELADKTSLMNEIMESLSSSEIPASQTHFKIPPLPNKETMGQSIDSKFSEENLKKDDRAGSKHYLESSGSTIGKDDFSWAELAEEESDEAIIEDLTKFDDIELDDNKLEGSIMHGKEDDLTSGTKNPSEQPTNLSIENKKRLSSSPRGSFKSRSGKFIFPAAQKYKPKSKSLSPSHPSHRTTAMYEDHREARRVMGEMFHEFNVNLTREFVDDLMYHFNMHGYITEDMIFMYIKGIQKERQISLFKRQETLVSKLMETAAAYGKHLENLKSNINVVQQMGDLAILKKSGGLKKSDDRGRSVSRGRYVQTSSSSKPIESSGVINPVPVFTAPSLSTKKKDERQWKPVERKESKETSEGGESEQQEREDKGKGLYDPSKDQKLQKVSSSQDKLMKDSIKSATKTERVDKKDGKSITQDRDISNEEIIFHGMDDAQLIVKAMMHISAPPELKDPELMIKLMDLLGRDIWVEILLTKEPRRKRDFVTELAEISMDLIDE
ncbi:TPA_asm: P [Zanthoxylum betacytorhabdovirus 3]|nr:TPA_asm: P [Zanthoxilum betacytorhabdovirus 3]